MIHCKALYEEQINWHLTVSESVGIILIIWLKKEDIKIIIKIIIMIYPINRGLEWQTRTMLHHCTTLDTF